jgi:formylglycine-generating enzyme required for sulfatase activity
VGRFWLFVWWALAAACGRLDFDPQGDGDANGDGVGPTGDGPPALSCSSLAAICGPTGTSPCCTSPFVPGGTFYRSYDVGIDNAYPNMTDPATVSTFRLDTYEVTVGRFRQFVSTGMGTQANPPVNGAGAHTLNGVANQGGWDATWNPSLVADTGALVLALQCDAAASWTDSPGANEALPMNCLTWFEAFAFCVWDGGFLPTEAEWNYAAAGGAEQRAYPWSSPPSSLTIDCSYANYNNGSYCVNPPTGTSNRVGSESPRGDGRWGHADLGGNVLEWTLDWYAPYKDPCDDCADLTPASYRVFRSGSVDTGASYIRGAPRNFTAPEGRGDRMGARCARSAQ